MPASPPPPQSLPRALPLALPEACHSAGGVVVHSGDLAGIYIEKLDQVLAEAGLDATALLRRLGVGLPPGGRWRDHVVPYERYLQLVQHLLDSQAVPGLATQLGRRFSITDFGILGYAMASSASLRAACQLMQKYQVLLGAADLFSVQLEETADHLVFSIDSHLPPGPLQAFELEVCVAQHACVTELLDARFRPHIARVHLSFAQAAQAQHLRMALCASLHYGQARTQLLYRHDVADAPLRDANAMVAAACEARCTLLLAGLQADAPWIDRIRVMLLQAPEVVPALESMATRLGLSERTLRRRLAEQGTSYTALVSEARMALARQYLARTDLAITQISHQLGFSETANFQRAFKRATGLTPLAFRQQQR